MRLRAALIVLVACTAAPQDPPAAPSLPTRLRIETAPVGLLAAVVPVPIVGTVRLLPAPAACRPAHGVNPLPVLPREIPVVGREVAITWATRAGGIPQPPDVPCWLIASFSGPEPVDFSSFGAPGCWVLPKPEQVVAVPHAATGTVRQDGGHVLFRWTPPAWATGTQIMLQLVVAAPGENRVGLLVSPAVEIIVGSA